jgi:biotin transport system substrate-specific component
MVFMQLAIQYIRNSHLLLTLIGASLLFFCGQVSIPLKPVPITLQTVAVLVIGLTFSKKDALKSVSLFLGLGALGAPVFANFSGGLAKLIGPAGGYCFGFFAAIWLMCVLRERIINLDTKKTFLVALAGSATVFLFGLSWLSTFVGWKNAIAVGFMPFIIPGIIKSALVASAVRYIKK